MGKKESYGDYVVLVNMYHVIDEVMDMQTINTWRNWLTYEKVGQAMRDIMEFYDDYATDRAEENIRQRVDEGDVDNSKWLLERLKSDKYSTKQKIDNNVTVKVRVQEF